MRQRLIRRLRWKLPLIFLLVSFAVWWQYRQEEAEQRKVEAWTQTTAFTGSWFGEVTYSSGDRHREEFFFQPEGGKLFGTASFLGRKRGIEEGKVEEGYQISFVMRFEDDSGGVIRERKNYYWGRLQGGQILLRLQDDGGSPPLEWLLSKKTLGGSKGDSPFAARGAVPLWHSD